MTAQTLFGIIPGMATVWDRIEERLKIVGVSAYQASMLATDDRNGDLLRDAKRKGTTPRNLDRLAEVLETTVGYLRTGRTDTQLLADRRVGYDPGAAAATAIELPRNLPVRGTARAHDMIFDDDGEVHVEAHEIDMGEAIDHLRRPPLLAGRDDVYAIYVQGTSMEPKFEWGDAVIVDTRRPASPGDYVVVQLAAPDGEQDMRRMALIKRLVRRSGTFVELLQFNPSITFKIDAAKITSIHRVLSLTDLLG